MPPSPTGGGSGGEDAGPSHGKEAAGDDAPPLRMGFSLSLASKKPAAAAAGGLKRTAALGGYMAPLDAAPRRELITGVAGK